LTSKSPLTIEPTRDQSRRNMLGRETRLGAPSGGRSNDSRPSMADILYLTYIRLAQL